MQIDYPRKVNFREYENSFNYYWWKKFIDGNLRYFDTEKIRGLLYGYTFTEDYAKGIIPDELSIEYWNRKNEDRFANAQKNTLHSAFAYHSLSDMLGQDGLICEAIESTGNGALDNPYCVICVEQEYEFLRSHRPTMKVVSQKLLPGHIDSVVLEEEGSYSETIYFNISRWFERNTNSCK